MKYFSFIIIILCLLSCNKSLVGIDVSHHNTLTEKDWNDLQTKENISFMYIKVSEGGTYKDPKRFEYARIAEKRNLKLGCYHFFRDDVSANKQVNNFFEATSDITNISLLPVIDFEKKGFHKNISEKVRYDRLEMVYCLLAHSIGGELIIYCNLDEYLKLKTRFPDAIFWVRNYPFETIMQITKKINGKWLDFN